MTRTTQVAAGAGLTLAGLAGVNALLRARAGRMPETLTEGKRLEYRWRYGRVSYQVAGEGNPLLLIHGTYAGACNYEWRHNFGFLARHFQVFAPDLLGFGHSDRPAMAYDDTLYADLIHDFTRDVITLPAVSIASSVSSYFLVADAAANPCAHCSIILVCPQAINARDGATSRAFGAFLRSPLIGTAAYNAIVSRPSIEMYLNRVTECREVVDRDLVRVHYKASHQRGSKWAATSFIGGALKRDVTGEFRSLQMPVLLVWGDSAEYTSVGNAAGYLEANPRADLTVFEECGSLPHQEYSERFNEMVLRRFQQT